MSTASQDGHSQLHETSFTAQLPKKNGRRFRERLWLYGPGRLLGKVLGLSTRFVELFTRIKACLYMVLQQSSASTVILSVYDDASLRATNA
ncbi:hypothetical protein C8J56DRAFT_1049008 [Mycena floridula]|nr:hypothetical protein C8J56DRAFT_1049008 [Mycena floridula]